MKKYLCKEEDEEFYVEANSIQEAQEICGLRTRRGQESYRARIARKAGQMYLFWTDMKQ